MSLAGQALPIVAIKQAILNTSLACIVHASKQAESIKEMHSKMKRVQPVAFWAIPPTLSLLLVLVVLPEGLADLTHPSFKFPFPLSLNRLMPNGRAGFVDTPPEAEESCCCCCCCWTLHPKIRPFSGLDNDYKNHSHLILPTRNYEPSTKLMDDAVTHFQRRPHPISSCPSPYAHH